VEETIDKALAGGTCTTFKLVDGDAVGDVLFEAGEYTLDEIIRLVNERSRAYSARRDGDVIRLATLAKQVKPVDGGHFATKHLTTELSGLRCNRHERRKAKASREGKREHDHSRSRCAPLWRKRCTD
jgi:hypothetical protein